jgi:hypothetical protein
VALVPAPAAAPPVAGNANAEIRRDYELAERVGTKEAWDSFVAANPAGFYTDLAKAQRNKLAAENARIAATDKARGAAEEQARLAVRRRQGQRAGQGREPDEGRRAGAGRRRKEEAG